MLTKLSAFAGLPLTAPKEEKNNAKGSKYKRRGAGTNFCRQLLPQRESATGFVMAINRRKSLFRYGKKGSCLSFYVRLGLVQAKIIRLQRRKTWEERKSRSPGSSGWEDTLRRSSCRTATRCRSLSRTCRSADGAIRSGRLRGGVFLRKQSLPCTDTDQAYSRRGKWTT